jgi:hypothetical protein
MESRFEIAVKGATPAESQRLAQELAASLKLTDPSVNVDRKKESADTLDLGATIAVIVGSAAATAVANGIRAWLAKRQDAEISISKDGQVKAKGITSADALRLAEIISRSK